MSDQPHLRARIQHVSSPAPTGLQPLGLAGHRDSYLYVPPTYQPAKPMPMMVLMHGAGGHAHDGLAILRHLADDAGLILVAPASRTHSWDVIVKRLFGPDVDLVDRALMHVFSRYAVDPAHVGIGGFSDGASYALSLGLANGNLFTHVMAFSPGFIAPIRPRGKPKVFLSHGIHDDILPIDPCGRYIAKRLMIEGYEVDYVEFDGGHQIPPDVALRAVEWFLAG